MNEKKQLAAECRHYLVETKPKKKCLKREKLLAKPIEMKNATGMWQQIGKRFLFEFMFRFFFFSFCRHLFQVSMDSLATAEPN